MRLLPLPILLLLAGCEANAELGLLLGPLRQVLPVAARAQASAVELELVLLGWEDQPLGPADRVRSGGAVHWLAELGPQSVHAQGRWQVGEAAMRDAPRARRLVYRDRARREVVALLIDNGGDAAAADRGLHRIAAAQAATDALLCIAPGSTPCAPRELALVVSAGGRAEVRVPRTREAARIRAALAELSASAGGASPLWDGLLAAVHELRAAAGAGALIGYVAGESGSLAGPAEGWGALQAAPALPAWLVAEPAILPALGGAGIPVGEGGVERGVLAGRCALDGAWSLELELDPGATPTAGQRLEGALELELGGERHRVSIDLPLGGGR